MAFLHVFLDESGSFRLHDRQGFLGGIIVERKQVRRILEDGDAWYQRLGSLLNGPWVHMKDLLERERLAAEAAYLQWFQATLPHVIRVVHAQSLPGNFLGPTEGWWRTAVQLMVGVAQAYPEDSITFHFNPYLNPIWSWLFSNAQARYLPKGLGDLDDRQNRLKNDYLTLLSNRLVNECKELTALSQQEIQVEMLETNRAPLGIPGGRISDVTVLMSLSDAYCSAMHPRLWIKDLPWHEELLLECPPALLERSERALLSQGLATPGLQAEVLWRLLELGMDRDGLYLDAQKSMDAGQWDVFCQIVQRQLVERLAHGLDRYHELPSLRRLAEHLPVHALGAPERLRWIQAQAIQKCDAHEGRTRSDACDQLLAIVQSTNPTPFPDMLERWQARIDVLVDSIQHEIVNALRMDRSADALILEIERYRPLVAPGMPDRNLARLAGTLGQVHALRASWPGFEPLKEFEQALKWFRIDLEFSGTGPLKEQALGYLSQLAIDRCDCDAAGRAVADEAAEVLHAYPDVLTMRSVDHAQYLVALLGKSDFLVLHELQLLALEPELSTDLVTPLYFAVTNLPASRLSRYPGILIAKWLAVMLASEAGGGLSLNLLEHTVPGDLDTSLPGATALIQSSLHAIKEELQGRDGIQWWQKNIPSLIPEDNPGLREMLEMKLSSHQERNVDKLGLLARVLPFYFH